MKHTFREKVREVVAGIPRGETMSYREVARAAGRPNACRAVGTIMARNTDPSVPCHRVVRSDGILGNYNRGGRGRKKSILESEGVTVVRHGRSSFKVCRP